MKRVLSFLLPVFLVCLLCACDPPPAMGDHLGYQQGPYRMEAVAEGAETVRFVAESDGETFVFRPIGEGTEAFSFTVSGEELFLCCEDLRIPLSPEAGHLAAAVYRMMTLDASGLWQITEETRDGGAVICCDSEDIRLELDKKTGFPVRIAGEGIEVRVSGFEMRN